MGETSPLVRQWLLIKLLSVRRLGISVKEISQELNVSEKTARRDLEALKTAGFPLGEQVGQFGRKAWKLDAPWAKTELSFTFDEALALYLGRRFLEPLAGTLFWEAAQRAFQKIKVTLGPAVVRYLDKMTVAFHQTTAGSSNYSQQAELLDELLMGIEERKATFITYQSAQATEPVTYDIHPYGITFHRGSLYLVGYAPRHGELRHWKVDRIEAAERTQVPFVLPDHFNLSQHFADSFGVYQGSQSVRVRVRFSRQVARYVSESSWHASQQLRTERDGSLVAEFQLSSTVEIKAWLLSFGRHAVVLHPKALRDEMLAEVQTMVETYTANQDGRSAAARK